MWNNIKCWWGLHEWAYVTPSKRHRVCKNCHHREELWFYSNRTEEWEDVHKGQEFFDFDKERRN